MIISIIGRIAATFVATALSFIGSGALIGVDSVKAAIMAGVGGVTFVLEGLARAYLDDGKITNEEIDNVFSKVDKSDEAESLGDNGEEPTA
jgi:hypothetical protein